MLMLMNSCFRGRLLLAAVKIIMFDTYPSVAGAEVIEALMWAVNDSGFVNNSLGRVSCVCSLSSVPIVKSLILIWLLLG